jgi:delta 1-pyrroline-5-carboxylate dehydrogenase
VLRSAALCKEEIFGPVALIFRIGSLTEAIALANDTPFGLAASVWTKDAAEQKQLASELQCGAVFFNTQVASDPRLPFGGTKRSGYGRELGAAGMREFLNAKTVVMGGASTHASQPSLFETPKSDSRNGQPSEFHQLAEQIRKFEPRKNPPPAPREPELEPEDKAPMRGSVLGL